MGFMRLLSEKEGQHMAVCVSVPCNPPPYAHVDIDGVGNAKINLEVDDVDGYVDVGLQGTDMHTVDVDVADAGDVIVYDVEGGLQGTDTHTAICC